MIFGKHEGIPQEIKAVGLDKWYSRLDDRDKIKLGRYLGMCDTSSEIAFYLSVIRDSNKDGNHPFSVVVGESALQKKMKDIDRFLILEEMIVSYFEMKDYDACFDCCNRGLDLLVKVRDQVLSRNGGELPQVLNCRSYKINVQVGIRFDYDGGDRTLDEYFEMGLISPEDLEFRKQSHKIYRLQKSFDGIYSIKIKDE